MENKNQNVSALLKEISFLKDKLLQLQVVDVIEVEPAALNKDNTIVIEIKEVEKRLRKQNSTLLELSTRINSKSEDFDSVIKFILKAASEVIEVSRISLWLLNENNSQMKNLCSFYNNSFFIDEFVFSKETFPSYFNTLTTDKIIIVDDVYADPRTSELIGFCQQFGITSALDVPLITNG
ncbi:MAG: GAF domain-containing protein, partial [Bacteroidetes bacterium]|nr:GAF domain-containing protein [Bacteroidota bacterium]